MSKRTQKQYMEYLDNCAPTDSDEWIIGGKLRLAYYHMGRYGEALKKFDPIAFRVGFSEWKRESQNQIKDPEEKHWDDLATYNERFTDY